jgi:hypothetical protein
MNQTLTSIDCFRYTSQNGLHGGKMDFLNACVINEPGNQNVLDMFKGK